MKNSDLALEIRIINRISNKSGVHYSLLRTFLNAVFA